MPIPNRMNFFRKTTNNHVVSRPTPQTPPSEPSSPLIYGNMMNIIRQSRSGCSACGK